MDAAAADFTQAVGLLVRRVRAAAMTQELSMTESTVLARLDREGPATIAELARAEAMRPQSMGAAVASLEEMGLLGRTPHPTDGRQMHIALTPAGAELRKVSKAAKRTWLVQAVAELSAAEQQTLFHAGEIMRRLALR
jgi:DNA-binding MarR family transcriptional regulator